ncbi:hypothetical protein LCGC14_0294470 [marine sediment metagenome]|uniref:Uncharacterized protein n=1 Tax=marine sediment metagenome TaxID=412755 RepID=A0A0F9TWY7_9ZZZZ
MSVTTKDVLKALRFVYRLPSKRITRFHPWPARIDDVTIRHARRHGYLDAYREFDGIVMAQNNFGAYQFVDELTKKGLKKIGKSP